MFKKFDINKIIKYIVIVAVVMFVAMFGLTVFSNIRNKQINKYPIVSISATNSKEYSPGAEIKAEDFKIKAVHENGKESTLSSDAIKLSTTEALPYGEATSVTLTLKDNKSISCTVKAKHKRQKLLSIDCGNPNKEDVQAVFYSNGELAFEGTGNVLQYDDDFPWQNTNDYDELDDYEITAITFEDGVTPTTIDEWFHGLDSLTYVGPIPASVQSMTYTFADCTALETAPDVEQCTALLNMSYAYENCKSLVTVPKMPSNVKKASYTFDGCVSLLTAPDFSNAQYLEDMTGTFHGCTNLINITLPDNVKILDETFEECINLTAMPEIPESVESMESTFSGDSVLATLTIIPKNVTSIYSCFEDCSMISGMLWVDANPENFDGCFQDAAVVTTVDLQGNSQLMDAIANTGSNITVDGKAPNPDINDYDDVFGNDEY